MSTDQAIEITSRQAMVLAYLRDFLAANDEIPPMWAISKHFGWKSTNSAQQHIDALAKKGVLERNAIGNWRFVRRAATEVAHAADHQMTAARQAAELACAERKALNQEQVDGMDDMGDYLEKLHTTQQDRVQALAAGVVQAAMGGRP